MAVQAGAGLRLRDALGVLLVDQHVGVAAPVAVVERERVAEEHALEPRVALDLLLGQRLTAAVPAEAGAGGLGGEVVAVELLRPVHAPQRRVGRVLGDLDHPEVGCLRLALALEDVHQQRRDQRRGNRHADDRAPG
jgi:hypothetical protein